MKPLRQQTEIDYTKTSTALNSSKIKINYLSPRHLRKKRYYKENNLVQDAKSFSSKTERYSTNLMDNKSLIKNTIFQRNLDDSFNGLMKRQDLICKYYNQDFREKSQSINLFGQSSRRNSNQSIQELEQSLGRERDKSNDIFIHDPSEFDRKSIASLRMIDGVFSQGKYSTNYVRPILQVERLMVTPNQRLQTSVTPQIQHLMPSLSKTGEISLERQSFISKDFLTNQEKKYGFKRNLESINKNFNKYSELQDKCNNIKSIDVKLYRSSSNFDGIYNPQLNIQFNILNISNLKRIPTKDNNVKYGMQGKSPILLNDLKLQQLKKINEMIVKKKIFDKGGIKQDMISTTQELNNEQKSLYQQIKQRGICATKQDQTNDSIKKYQSNSQSKSIWEAKQRQGMHSTMGVQQYKYDIINNSIRKASIQNQSQRIILKKVNGISEYSQDTHITAPNYSKDYQKALLSNQNIFRKGQGDFSKFSNSAVSHALIIPAFRKA